jgi:FAD/FMN-containing dehydrogenase
MLRFGEVEAAVSWQLGHVQKLLPPGGGKLLHVAKSGESEQFWRDAASAREMAATGEWALIKCSVSYQSAAETAGTMEEAGKRLGARTLLYCHAGTHVLYGRFEWGPETASVEDIRNEFAALRTFCAAREGHTIIERAPAGVKKDFDVWGYTAPALNIMKRLKHEFDPKGLLNPGRFVGGI